MNTVFWVLLLGTQAAGLFLLYVLVEEMRRTRCLLENRLQRASISISAKTTVSSDHHSDMCPYAIWSWHAVGWRLEPETVPRGYAAKEPPSFAGSFPGQRVKTQCTKI